MARRLRLEGESLDAVLAQARRLHGPDARIVSAERVITGGFKGLFGRQHYEAVVEVGDAPPRTAVGPVRFPPPAGRASRRCSTTPTRATRCARRRRPRS